MKYLLYIATAFCVSFVLDAGQDLFRAGDGWRPGFLVLGLINASIDFVFFLLVPLSVLYRWRVDAFVFVAIGITVLAIYVFFAGHFYVSLTGLRHLTYGSTPYVSDGTMMPAFYFSKLLPALLAYCLTEVIFKLGSWHRQRRARSIGHP